MWAESEVKWGYPAVCCRVPPLLEDFARCGASPETPPKKVLKMEEAVVH